MHLDPRERFIDRPDVDPEDFTRGIDLNKRLVTPAPPTNPDEVRAVVTPG